MGIVVIVTGMAGVVAGSVSAAIADIFPAYRARLQEWGSSLLVGSVALLGLAFPLI